MKKLTLIIFIFTSDVFSQWTFDAMIPDDGIHSPIVEKICVIDSTVSWAMGRIHVNQNYFSPFFAKKDVNGWKYISTDLDPDINIYSFTAIDSLKIWLGSYHPDNIYYSSNGGRNWAMQFHVADTGHIVGITFCKENNLIGYALCHLAFNSFWNGVSILKTTNGGINWTRWNFEYYGYNAADNSMSIVDSNYAWFGIDDVLSDNSKIISTTDGGQNWNIKDINASYVAPFTIQFSSDKQTGVFVGETPPTSWFYRTTNAGINWNIVYTTSNYYSETMVWIPGTSNIYGNSEFALVRSINSGLTWQQMTGGPGTNLKSMGAVRINPEIIYALAVTYDRKVYKLLDTARIIGIENNENLIPKEYKLYQNYPNPFNPTTKISYELPKSCKVNIIIYDILGNEVNRLVNNEFKQIGRYTIDLNAYNFASGVYFYKIEAGNFIQSKKMVLIK